MNKDVGKTEAGKQTPLRVLIETSASTESANVSAGPFSYNGSPVLLSPNVSLGMLELMEANARTQHGQQRHFNFDNFIVSTPSPSEEDGAASLEPSITSDTPCLGKTAISAVESSVKESRKASSRSLNNGLDFRSALWFSSSLFGPLNRRAAAVSATASTSPKITSPASLSLPSPESIPSPDSYRSASPISEVSWSCQRCTYANDPDSARCEMCNSFNPLTTITDSESETSEDSESPPSDDEREALETLTQSVESNRGDTNASASTASTTSVARDMSWAGVGGALMGSMAGGFLAIISGKGAVDGAITGAGIGAFVSTAPNIARGYASASVTAASSTSEQTRQRNYRYFCSNCHCGIRGTKFRCRRCTERTPSTPFYLCRKCFEDADLEHEHARGQFLMIVRRGRVRMSPTDEVTMDELPERQLTSEDIQSLPSNQRNCVVCLQDYESGESITTLPCLHRFHTGCIEQWLSNSRKCPMCKNPVN